MLDIRMPRMTGLDLQEKLIAMGSRLPIIFITGHGDIPMAVEAMRRGAVDFIRKPFREHDLLDRINEALASMILSASRSWIAKPSRKDSPVVGSRARGLRASRRRRNEQDDRG